MSIKEEITENIRTSVANYKKSGINITILDHKDDKRGDNGLPYKVVKIKQERLINGFILTQKQLVERANEVFKFYWFPIQIVPVVYSLNVDDITLDWILSKMKTFGVSRKDLIKQLAIDKSSLSLKLSGERALSKLDKAAFFYYFLVYELNRDFRD